MFGATTTAEEVIEGVNLGGAAYLEEVGRVHELGVAWIGVNSCGDDPGDAEETVPTFGEQVVAPAKEH